MGSVKNLQVLEKPEGNVPGKGIFTFTDDYSVFDYGKMPDPVPDKGGALSRMAAYNFIELQKRGIASHYIAAPAPDQMEVKLVRVLDPATEKIEPGTVNYLLPVEWIFRNQLPEGSSVFKRFDRGELKPEDLGLSEMPKPGAILEKPLIDYSTKLEATDRYITAEEAKELCALTDAQFTLVQKAIRTINDYINYRAEKTGLVHADGKVEFALDEQGSLLLVDVCGTPDENRLLYDNVHISKQVLRDYYKTTPWANELEQAQNRKVPKPEWPAPPPLPEKLQGIAADMYKSVCEQWTGQSFWDAPSIEETVARYRAFSGK